jgi:hypothetical protein
MMMASVAMAGGRSFGNSVARNPVERCGPEDGAEILVEEPWEVEGEIANGEADGDGDEEQKKTEETAD